MKHDGIRVILLVLMLLCLGGCLCTALVAFSPFVTNILLLDGTPAPPGMAFLAAFLLGIVTLLLIFLTIGIWYIFNYAPSCKKRNDQQDSNIQERLLDAFRTNVQLQLDQTSSDNLDAIWKQAKQTLPNLDGIRKGKLIRFLCDSVKNAPIDLKDTDLSGAELVGVDLSNINFSGANLSGADLSQANLENSQITSFQLKQARSFAGAILPLSLQQLPPKE